MEFDFALTLFREVMSYPVTTLRTTENVGRIVDILKKEGHVGFPIVDNYDPDAVSVCVLH